MEDVDLGEPTSFLDHVHLGCTQRWCKISCEIVANFRDMVESRISCVLTQRMIVWVWWRATWTVHFDDEHKRWPSCMTFSMAVIRASRFSSAPTILTAMSAAANARTELREFRPHFGLKSVSVFFFFAPGMAVVVARGLVDGCSCLPLVRCSAPANDFVHPSMHFGTRTRRHSSSQRCTHMVSQRCAQSKAKTLGRSFAS